MTVIDVTDPAAREDLDPRGGECLVCYVDRLLARGDCTGRLVLVRWWRELRAPRATGLEDRLHARGVRCDCEVLAIGYEPSGSLELRRAGMWDRPACGQVRTGSSQPCALWRLRPRWRADGQGATREGSTGIGAPTRAQDTASKAAG